MNAFGENLQHRMGAIQRAVTEARTELSSEDYAVKVTVGPNGAVHDIELTSRAAKYDAEELGELVVQQLRLASAQMSRELRETLSALTGNVSTAASADLPSLPSAAEIQRMREDNRRTERGETP